MLFHAIISAYTSSRSVVVPVEGHMTGLNVPTLILERKLAEETLAGIIIPVPPVPTFAREGARRGTRVSLPMVFLSAGCTLLVIEPNHVKMALLVDVQFVFLPIRQISSESCLITTRMEMDLGRVIWKSDLLGNIIWTRIWPRVGLLLLLPLRFWLLHLCLLHRTRHLYHQAVPK